MDFQESLFFYSIPPLLFLNSLFEFKKGQTTLLPLTYFFQGILTTLFLISTILSLNPGGSYYFFWSFITVILIVNLANIYITNLEKFFSTIIFLSLAYSIALIAGKTGVIELPLKGLGDNFIRQVWGHSYLGNYLLIPITICYHRFNHKNFIHYSILLTIFGITLFLSQSRSGAVGAIVAILLTSPTNSIQRTLKKILVTILITSLILLFIASSRDAAYLKSSDGSRPEFWRQAINGIYTSPVFGNGPGTFKLVNQQFKKPGEAVTSSAHNSVLELMTNNGLIFTTIFLLYIYWGLKYQSKSQPIFFSVGLGLFISSLLDSFLSFPGFLATLLITATYRHPHLYHSLPTPHHKTNIPLAALSAIILLFFILKTSSDIAYYKQQYPLSIQLDPANINSLLQLHDQKTIKNMLQIFPREESALLSAIKYSHLPNSVPYYQRLFQINPQIDPDYYYQLGRYYLEAQKFDDLSQLLDSFDTQFSERQDSLPQLNISKLFYYLSIHRWQENKHQESIGLIKKSIYYSIGWSHFHIELANMYWHSQQKSLAISQLQQSCHQHPASVTACDKYLSDNKKEFLKPGSPVFFEGINVLTNQ